MDEILIQGGISLTGIVATIAVLRAQLRFIADRQREEIGRGERQDIKLVEHEVRIGKVEQRCEDRRAELRRPDRD